MSIYFIFFIQKVLQVLIELIFKIADLKRFNLRNSQQAISSPQKIQILYSGDKLFKNTFYLFLNYLENDLKLIRILKIFLLCQ